MKEESHNPFSDRELEARIVALVLGEASDFERDELNRLIEQRPELATFKEQMQGVHRLLQNVGAGESPAVDDNWKLSDDKRSAVLAVIGGDAEQQSATQTLNQLAEERRAIRRDSFLWTLTKIAAVICFVVVPGSLAMVSFYYQHSAESLVAYRDGHDSKDASGSLRQEYSAAAGGYSLSDDDKVTAADEQYFQSVEPSTGAVVDFEKNSQSALSDIRDSLDVDGIATTPSGDEGPSVTLGLDPAADRFESGKPGTQSSFGGFFDSGATSANGVNGPEPPELPPADDPTFTARDKAEKPEDLYGEAAGDGEWSYPQFAGSAVRPNAFDRSEPEQSTISAHKGTVLLGDTTRSAEGRSGPTVSGEAPDSSPATPGHFQLEGESQDVTSEQAVVSGLDKGLSRESVKFDASATAVTETNSGALRWPVEADSQSAGDVERINDLGGIGERPGGGRFGGAGFGGGGRLPADERQLDGDDFGTSAASPIANSITGPANKPVDSNEELSETLSGTTTTPLRGGQEAGQVQQGIAGGLSSDEGESHVNQFRGQSRSDLQIKQDGFRPSRGQPALSTQSHPYVPSTLINKSKLMTSPPVKRYSASAGLDEKDAESEAFSTFSLHVSDVSFKTARAALAQGQWPEAEKVRIEEFVNAFDYGDPMPSQSERVACRLEQSIHPFLQQRNLLRVSMRTAAAGRSSTTPLRLTLLLDNSGSMERIDRQQTVRRAFALLAQQLQPIDQVTLISFARQPRLLADRVSGAQSHQLVQLIEDLPSEGGTNIEAALHLAFEKAREQQLEGAQNRIILLTDGAVNLGDANPESLSRMITTMRNAGIAFDAAGISAQGLNDQILEALTRKGDGRYYLLDSLDAADDGFARQIAGALRPSAKNVKVQIEFNPKRVGRYKLLGFEKHRLKQEDFRNDKVDAAEMAAAEAGVAVYQFQAKPDGQGDVGSVSVRFLDLSTGQMIENRWPIPYEADAPRPDQATPSLRIATAAALLATKLRGEPLGDTVDLKTLSDLITGLPDLTRNATRVQQLHLMIQQARQLSGN